MRAISVSVDYADFLAITLPWNRHHWEEVMVVTSPQDHATQQVADAHGARLYQTTAFWDRGALFNKWAALEEGLDAFGRQGLLCIVDADILWPRDLPIMDYLPGKLYTPYRRMMFDMRREIPPECEWAVRFRRHGNTGEWAGYSQIFHADDPALGPAPWHETNWRHAGGADSVFQRRWLPENKIRPPWECLHLGQNAVNWCGRTRRGAAELQRMLQKRRTNRDMSHERIEGEQRLGPS